MIFDRCYIITYKSDKWSDKEWAKRYTNHKTQVEYFLRKGLNVYIFAQNYSEDLKVSGVTYLEWDGVRRLPGDARNVCLKHFYNSDQDFTLLMDDDVVLLETVYKQPHLDSINFINEFRNYSIVDLKNIDVFSTLQPKFDPYGVIFSKNKNLMMDYWVFKRRPQLTGQFVFIKNISKHKNKEVFYPENWASSDGGVRYGEDQAFTIDCQLNGLNCFQLENIVFKDMGLLLSTHAPTKDKEAMKAAYIQCKLDMLDRYPELTKLTLPNGDFRIQWQKFVEKYNPYPKILLPKSSFSTLGDF